MANDNGDPAESPHDFYELLGVTEGSTETEIRSAYRKTALKYHPDKVGPNNTEALDKFHLLQIAYDCLSDPATKERYDAKRRAKQEKAARVEALQGKRKSMMEDLERREDAGTKRQKTELDAQLEHEKKLARLREDTQRRRRAMEEMNALQREEDEIQRKKASGEYVEDATDAAGTPNGGKSAHGSMDMEHRTVKVRFPANEESLSVTKEKVDEVFERFGPVEEVMMLGEKKIKVAESKHRQPFRVAAVIYKSVVGAHAAVTDFDLLKTTSSDFEAFHSVVWGSGKEPGFIPKSNRSESPATPTQLSTPSTPLPRATGTPKTPSASSFKPTPFANVHGLKSKPSFGSFKATSTPRAADTPTNEELMHIRLRNAEKKRMEEQIRREEAAAGES